MDKQYNLTPKIGQYLDLHMLLKILNFYEKGELYDGNELLKAKIDLLSKTYMVAYATEEYQRLHNTKEEPEEMTKQKEMLMERHRVLLSRPFLGLFSEERKPELLKINQENNWTLSFLQTTYNVTNEDVNSLYELAKFYFEVGQYPKAIELLRYFRAISNADPEKHSSALWGKLAAEILMANWEEAFTDFEKLIELVESPSLSSVKQLQERVYLAHWSLFGLFQRTNFLDLLLGNEGYIRAIQIKAPWLLRYLSIAVIVRKQHLKELVELVEIEHINYSDPIVDLIYFLYIKFDFDAAEKQLDLCRPILEQDYFISGMEETKTLKDDFLEAAKLAICESFCKVHSTIDIGMMATKLGKSNSESERWIVNLIRNSKFDAKIDSAKNQVIVSSRIPNIHDQILEKTKALYVRAGTSATNVERMKLQQRTSKKEDLS